MLPISQVHQIAVKDAMSVTVTVAVAVAVVGVLDSDFRLLPPLTLISPLILINQIEPIVEINQLFPFPFCAMTEQATLTSNQPRAQS